MGKHSLDTPGRKRKDLDATKLDWLDVATKVIVLATATVKLVKVIVLATATVKLVEAMLHMGL